jgi:hypothetical protein
VKLLIYINLLILTLGCSQMNPKESNFDLKRRNIDEYYTSSGITRYFLPDLPAWANFSDASSCKRNVRVRYVNYKKLQKSFSMNYAQSVQFQMMYNRRYTKMSSLSDREYIPLKEEEKLFRIVSDKVQSHILDFKVSKFKSVYVISLDPTIKHKNYFNSLKNKIKNGLLNQAPPIFFSLCLSENEIASHLKKLDYDGPWQAITYRMLSPFNSKGEIVSLLHIELDKIFKKNQEISFYGVKGVPNALKGKIKFVRY